jgi:hypothetical protein
VERGPETGEIGPHGGEWSFFVLLYFDVENRGEYQAGRFENWLVSEGRVGRQGAGRGLKNSLRPHERKTYAASFLIPLEYAGRTLRIRAYVDPLGETTESDEANNSSDWLEVRLPSLPDLSITIDNIEVTDTSTYPDLDFCTITITVRNSGTVHSGTTSGVEIWILEREGWNLCSWSRGFRSLAPGESLTYPFAEDLTVSKTATRARAIIDPGHWTLEVDRSNNQAERNFP